MKRQMVAGNWKMHGLQDSVEQLMQDLKMLMPTLEADIVLFPGFLHLDQVRALLKSTPWQLGAQDCAFKIGEQALTGEVSATQLQDLGCRYVLVGHSERRHLMGECSQVVARKFAAAQEAGLTPILCVGETQAERDAQQTEVVIAEQLEAVRRHVGASAMSQAILAYEPVWAIGTGLTATPEQAQAVHQSIRQWLFKSGMEDSESMRLLYGGSVKSDNARQLMSMSDVDGLLVGSAALSAQSFADICLMVEKSCGNA